MIQAQSLAPRRRRIVSATVAIAVVAASTSFAFAQSASDKAAAEALFDEGKKAMGDKKYDVACNDFASSDRLAPAVGTKLNLANCYEKSLKTASAWAMFREAAAYAHERGEATREKFAREQAARLESTLSRLTISVPKSTDVAGLVVKRDGETIDRALWGTALPVDGGPHVIEATAPGKALWSKQQSVAPNGDSQVVEIGPLFDAAGGTTTTSTVATTSPASATSAPTAASPSTTTSAITIPDRSTGDTSSGSGQRTAGLIVGAIGVVGLGVGGFFALRAKSKDKDAADHCQRPNGTCDPEGVALGDDAHNAATLSTIAVVAGTAAIAGGVILFLTAPKSSSTVALDLGSSSSRVGLTLRGEF